jgi:nicotinate-nucleotide adenylyltransferase
MPAGSPPHKPIAQDPGAQRRLEMCRLLLDGVANVCASDMELERDGPSYTVNTVRAIHESHPEAELTFIVGADIAGTLPAWHEAPQLLGLADLAVAARPGSDRDGLLDALAPLGETARVRFLDAPLIDASSSLVRERAARGKPVEQLVGPGVAGYIAEHGLYRTPARAVAR